jgi:glycerol-3-phosphate cytidylyltransferase
LGDRVIVGVSTDEFNTSKGKRSVVSYGDRAEIVRSIKGVDLVIPESSWDQKTRDIEANGVDIFVMGDDWRGKFDDLEALCEVRYLPRTEGISSSELKQMLRALDPAHIEDLQSAVSTLSNLLSHYRDLA